MAVDIAPLSDAEISRLFDRPGTVPANTFEVALVLGGTVSSGAYTAGAIDFLIEALDAWAAAREAGQAGVPRHRVVIRVISGNSGGAVCAAIAARALAYRFPHVRRASDTATAAQNPLYDTWVNRLSLEAMLTSSDLDGSKPALSLLNGQVIDDAAQHLTSFSAETMARGWVGYPDDPLRLTFCMTNLNGIPYRIDFSQQAVGGSASADFYEPYINHADHVRFAVRYPQQASFTVRPDEFSLDFEGQPGTRGITWKEFGQYACASSAFPIGFPPRPLTRPLEDYRYRVAAVPGARTDRTPGAQDVLPCAQLIPDWAALQDWAGGGLPDQYPFLAVDGGVTDNEPIELARVALSGVGGRNPRDGATADRGVVLIDPFAGSARMVPRADTTDPTLAGLAAALLKAVPQQTRYDSRDLLLATHPDIYSRFMIAACNDGKVGDPALATSGLDAFLGFASAAFRRHDYLLGRKNCQDFLRTTFVLPTSSAVFVPDEAVTARFGLQDSAGAYLPLVPLIGDVAVPEALDPWPKGALDPEIFRDPIRQRFGRLIEAELHGSLIKELVAWAARQFGAEKFADFAIGQLKAALAKQGL